MSLAVCVIASEKRRASTFPLVLESVRAQSPDEIVVVADFPCVAKGVRSFYVPALTRTTIDALVKRDVGTVATWSDYICYLTDDHILAPEFVDTFYEQYQAGEWDMLCPARYTVRDQERIWLNVGKDHSYIGGHCGIYPRDVIAHLPWSAGPHHRNWDLLYSHELVKCGARLMYADTDLAVEDIEPGATPWL